MASSAEGRPFDCRVLPSKGREVTLEYPSKEGAAMMQAKLPLTICGPNGATLHLYPKLLSQEILDTCLVLQGPHPMLGF